MSSQPQKVSLYNVSDLKNATDDAIAPYLTSLPKPYAFKQQHFLTNVKLIVGYTAVTIAGVLFYADWKLGWDATKPYTAPACVLYFCLNSFLTYWIWFTEAGTVFVGTRDGGQKLTLKSSTKKHKPLYKLRVLYEAPSGKQFYDREIEGNFTDWFNVHGYLDKKALKGWLANNIEVVGLADPESKKHGKDAAEDESADEELVSPMAAEVSGVAGFADGGSASKRKSKRKA